MLLFELMTMKRPYHDVAPLQVSETNAQGVRPALPADLDEVEFKVLEESLTMHIGSRFLTKEWILC